MYFSEFFCVNVNNGPQTFLKLSLSDQHSYVPSYDIILRYYIVGRTSLKKETGTEKLVYCVEDKGLQNNKRRCTRGWE
jgi:hypothetical protein